MGHASVCVSGIPTLDLLVQTAGVCVRRIMDWNFPHVSGLHVFKTDNRRVRAQRYSSPPARADMTIPFPLPQRNPSSSFTAQTLLRLVLYLKCSSTNTSPPVHYVTVLAWIHKWMEHYLLRLHRPSKIHNCCEAEPWHFLSTCLRFSFHSVPHKRALFPARIRVTQTRVTRNLNAQNGCNICVTASDFFFLCVVNVLKKRSTAFCVHAGKKCNKFPWFRHECRCNSLKDQNFGLEQICALETFKKGVSQSAPVCVVARQERHNCTTA